MSDDKTAVAEPVTTEVEAPFGTVLEDFFKTPSTSADTSEPTPDSKTPKQDDSTETPTDTQAEAGDSSESTPKPKKAGSPRPVNVEAKLKGLEKGFYKVTRENAELRKKIQALEGDGSDAREPTPDEVVQSARFQERQNLSLRQAVKTYGEDHINEMIFAEGSPYRQYVEVEGQSWMRDRVLSSDDPIQTALDLVNMEQFCEQYGRSPETIKEMILEEKKDELKAEVLKELKANPSLVGKTPPSLARARTASAAQKPADTNAPNLEQINPAFNLRAIA